MHCPRDYLPTFSAENAGSMKRGCAGLEISDQVQ
ncbi:unnamed protein product [Nezara viridula]|uniref:Uncharacterized protein n=1 Tax=Nezara viridula TaxID=85310 RepID=A0A9P0E2F9_NEZVI|nr:unnamed protein product [Nezara viridula]